MHIWHIGGLHRRYQDKCPSLDSLTSQSLGDSENDCQYYQELHDLCAKELPMGVFVFLVVFILLSQPMLGPIILTLPIAQLVQLTWSYRGDWANFYRDHLELLSVWLGTWYTGSFFSGTGHLGEGSGPI